MDEIEKKARELLAAELNPFDARQIRQGHTPARCVAALRAVIAALSAAPQDGYKAAYDEWMDKTEWVQKSATVAELGMHRADVLRMRIEALQVPDGWVLVPVEPTDEMSWAGTDIEVGYPTWAGSRDSCTGEEARAIWKAMLAAKPETHA
ncbi:hypothetical protein [Xanthomonas campestris]|uniref:hypothetical protein n=1 Tax=Xanthomonas campestris TaxID=339 RepID=UPI0005AF027E|nr:hypothetical protein [Xanthomonas campestris]KIQ21563.1 hypothetical protein RT95_20670 [Xanthomonas campestris]